VFVPVPVLLLVLVPVPVLLLVFVPVPVLLLVLEFVLQVVALPGCITSLLGTPGKTGLVGTATVIPKSFTKVPPPPAPVEVLTSVDPGDVVFGSNPDTGPSGVPFSLLLSSSFLAI
jgi:hypothetical protein